jgi:hypothetical protein
MFELRPINDFTAIESGRMRGLFLRTAGPCRYYSGAPAADAGAFPHLWKVDAEGGDATADIHDEPERKAMARS